MPELIEVELYRTALDHLHGGVVECVTIPDQSFIRPKDAPAELFKQVVGSTLAGTRRHGKLLLLDLVDSRAEKFTVGLRFGMTGRLIVDGHSPIDVLEYASPRNDPAWDRALITIDGHLVSVRDQRRLGSIELDPDTRHLGVEATWITATELRTAIGKRSKPVKAFLLDQQLIAGIGNLLVDEILWQVGLAPTRALSNLDHQEVDLLATEIRATVARLTSRGGSHTGDTFSARELGAECPRGCGEMLHDTVGGRSTWWCPTHQR